MYTERFSEMVELAGAITPIATAAEHNSGWIDMSKFSRVAIVVSVGTFGTNATVDVDIEQAQDSSGTGAKNITGKSITQLTDAGTDDDKHVVIEVQAEELDVNNGFTHIQVELTIGTATVPSSAVVFGFPVRYQPASVTQYDEVVD